MGKQAFTLGCETAESQSHGHLCTKFTQQFFFIKMEVLHRKFQNSLDTATFSTDLHTGESDVINLDGINSH